MGGRAAADVQHRAAAAAPGDVTQQRGVVGLAGELVGEVGGVLLGDPIEGGANFFGHVPTRSVAPRSRSSAIVER